MALRIDPQALHVRHPIQSRQNYTVVPDCKILQGSCQGRNFHCQTDPIWSTTRLHSRPHPLHAIHRRLPPQSWNANSTTCQRHSNLLHLPLHRISHTQASNSRRLPRYDKWRIKFNPAKCQAVLFSGKRNPYIPRLFYGDVVINWSPTAQYLSIHFDTRLTWKIHVDHTVKKSRTAIITMYGTLKNPKL